MELDDYLKALEIRKTTYKENYNYLYGELGVYGNYLIALGAQFFDVVDYFRKSPKWAYGNKSTGTLEERTSPDSNGLVERFVEIRKNISDRIDFKRRIIEREIRKKIPLEDIDDVELWDIARKQAEKEYEEGKIYSGEGIWFNSLDFHVVCQINDISYIKDNREHLGDKNPDSFARYNQRVSERNYRSFIMLHPGVEEDSQNKETDLFINGANAIIQISNELIVLNRIPAIFVNSKGSKHLTDFDRIVFYVPEIQGECR